MKLKNLNTSSFFYYPLLGIDEKYNEFLVNTFFYNSAYPELPEVYYILYKFDGHISRTGTLYSKSTVLNPIYENLEKLLISHEDYYFHDDINKGEYILFCFLINENLSDTYNKILNGKYSEIDSNHKTMCINFWKNPSIFQILNKDEKFRVERSEFLGIEIPKGQEVWSIPDVNNETFNESKLTSIKHET